MKDALAEMAKIVGDEANIAGGVSGALETDFPGSVTNAFKENPDAAQVIEGDFVESEIDELDSVRAGDGLQRLRLPGDRRLRSHGGRRR